MRPSKVWIASSSSKTVRSSIGKGSAESARQQVPFLRPSRKGKLIRIVGSRRALASEVSDVDSPKDATEQGQEARP